MEVRKIPAEATYDLRARVLRPGKPLAASHYARDHEGVHFGLFEGAESGPGVSRADLSLVGGKILSTVTAHPESHPLFPEKGQWRIRGMATEPGFQGRGFGAKVLEVLLEWGRKEGVALFWCNARERAIPFYQRAGFTVESELFEIPEIGPHKVMRIRL